MDLKLKMGTALSPQVSGKRQGIAPSPRFGSGEQVQPDRSALHGMPKSYVLFGARPQNLTNVADFEARLIANKGYPLFDFQREAMKVLERGESVVVPARTSSGKTLVAEYGIEDALVAGKSVYYTAPRKAISNEKYFEFCERYGEENVGMMTGDVTLRPNAPIVLMTTEILRNMLYQPGENRQRLKDLQYIVFDECHFMSDEERGMVWEEAIMYARHELPETQQILLSATIGNARQLTGWLNSLNKNDTPAGKFSCIGSDKRPVPLTEQYLSADGNLVDILDAQGRPTAHFIDSFGRTASMRKKKKDAGQFYPMQVVQALKRANQLPLLEFVFGRRQCEEYAQKTFENADRLKLVTDEEKAKIKAIIDAYVATYPSMAESRLIPLLMEGIGYEHADMYFREKEMVGLLRQKGLLKVSYGTTAVAEGVNGPTQSVGLSALDIHMPTGWRPISESEYQQATGRAGRLGWYQRGYAVLSHPKDDDMRRVISLVKSKPNPIDSQFRITPYQALNYLDRLPFDQIKTILQTNFKTYQSQNDDENDAQPEMSNSMRKRMQREAGRRGVEKTDAQLYDFKVMQKFLEDAGYLDRKGKLTSLGHLSAQIPMESSLLIARAVSKGLFEDLTPPELAALVSAAVSNIPSPEQKKDEGGFDIGSGSQSPVLSERLRKLDGLLQGLYQKAGSGVDLNVTLNVGAVDTVAAWAKTHKKSLLDDSPGLLTYTILRTANMLKHIADASDVSERLRENATQARQLLLDGVILEQIQPKRVVLPD